MKNLFYRSLYDNGTNTSNFMQGNWTRDVLALFFVSKGQTNGLRGLILANELLYARIALPLSDIQTLRFGTPNSTDYGLKAGTRLEVWGVL